jgi:ketosteroid isomerase-like protein
MLTALLSMVLATTAVPAVDADVRSLVAAERAFATDALARGTRPAFLAVLDGSSVVFEPAPADGRAVWTARPARASVLAWEPEFAEAASSGELGYTTGPWTWRKSAADSVSARGHYLSVWRRDDAGTWRLLVDIGHSHAAVPMPALVMRTLRAARAGGAGTASLDALVAGEARLAARAAEAGPEVALLEALAKDGRVCREGLAPAIGQGAARALPWPAGSARMVSQAAAASRDGSLGFTRGLIVRETPGARPDTASYLRVWRRDGRRWNVAADVELPWSSQ